MTTVETPMRMGSRRKILFIQHAGALGGSCMSLLYTIRALDKQRFHPVVALIRPVPNVVQLYASEGIDVIPWPGIITAEHTTAQWARISQPTTWLQAARTITQWRRAEQLTLALVAQTKPDIVHLNSVVLSPSARALHCARIPFVWHVRESPVTGYFGLRRAAIRKALRRWPSEVIFLSQAEKDAWVGGARGIVVPNFVEMSAFNPDRDQRAARKGLGVSDTAQVVAYLGGPGIIKGIFPLLQALPIVRGRVPELVCLMPASDVKPSGRIVSRVARAVLPVLGSGTLAQRVASEIRSRGLERVCIRLGFVRDIEGVMAAADVVVFPAIEDHFARPIVEGAAMRKPSVASRLPILTELVDHGVTGLLVTPGDSRELADAIVLLLNNPGLRARMGANARARACDRHDGARNVTLIEDAYDRVLNHRNDSDVPYGNPRCGNEHDASAER